MALARDELARRIRSAYERSGKTFAQIGEEMDGTNWRVAQRWASGENAPRPSKLDKLAEVLGVNADFFKEPHAEHIYDRLERKLDENARSGRTVLGLLDELLQATRDHDTRVNEHLAAVTGRLADLEARQDAHDAQLTQIQTEVLQIAGVTPPPPATPSRESETTPGSTQTPGNAPARN